MKTKFTQLKVYVFYFLLVIAILLSRKSFAQLSTGVASNFGIDGDVKSDYRQNGTFSATGTHDWFRSNSGSGIGVIDTTNASLYTSLLAAGKNPTFDRGMSVPVFTMVDGNLMIDTRYSRDNFGFSTSPDTTDYTTFSSGSKNGSNPTSWLAVPAGSSVNDKADIIDAYVHLRRNGSTTTGASPSHLIMFTAVSTVSNNGSRYYEAEFYNSKISYDSSSGTFSNSGPSATGGHSVFEFNNDGTIKAFGDMTISFSYFGVNIDDISIYIWVSKNVYNNIDPKDFDFVKKEFYGDGMNAQYGYAKISSNGSGTITAWGSANSAITNSPVWGTTSKAIGNANANYYSVNYDQYQFGEAAVDLTALGIDPAFIPGNTSDTVPFSRVLFKSRSSVSFTSALQDFAGPYRFLEDTRTSVLPITLSYFNARPENNSKVILNWVTESELNNEYYTIERSQDNKNYKPVAMVLGALTTSIRQSYEYKDNVADVDLSKVIYYRIKQTDIDGRNTYSPVRSVKFNQKKNLVQVNPNPIVDNITVKYWSEANGSMDIRLINTNGQLVANKKSNLNKGFNNIVLNNLGSLNKGLYVAELIINGELIEQTKLIKH
ncbi:MAG TPA: T9SS type A sorting domain-containing protein [Chitinophagaceae bacterium]|nr:T9SS type A sorting domain-containing protein [Chitinophagaceae bacterium]